jgi:hypothetical protein
MSTIETDNILEQAKSIVAKYYDIGEIMKVVGVILLQRQLWLYSKSGLPKPQMFPPAAAESTNTF